MALPSLAPGHVFAAVLFRDPRFREIIAAVCSSLPNLDHLYKESAMSSVPRCLPHARKSSRPAWVASGGDVAAPNAHLPACQLPLVAQCFINITLAIRINAFYIVHFVGVQSYTIC